MQSLSMARPPHEWQHRGMFECHMMSIATWKYKSAYQLLMRSGQCSFHRPNASLCYINDFTIDNIVISSTNGPIYGAEDGCPDAGFMFICLASSISPFAIAGLFSFVDLRSFPSLSSHNDRHLRASYGSPKALISGIGV
jgi:hypothetical protein